jgi:hypothetical protein
MDNGVLLLVLAKLAAQLNHLQQMVVLLNVEMQLFLVALVHDNVMLQTIMVVQ